jgi:hypothetical protein
MNTLTDVRRFQEDYCNQIDCVMAQNLKQVFLILTQGAQTTFNDAPTAGSTTITRLTIGQGYASFLPADGYANPRVELVKGRIDYQAQGQLSESYLLDRQVQQVDPGDDLRHLDHGNG